MKRKCIPTERNRTKSVPYVLVNGETKSGFKYSTENQSFWLLAHHNFSETIQNEKFPIHLKQIANHFQHPVAGIKTFWLS